MAVGGRVGAGGDVGAAEVGAIAWGAITVGVAGADRVQAANGTSINSARTICVIFFIMIGEYNKAREVCQWEVFRVKYRFVNPL